MHEIHVRAHTNTPGVTGCQLRVKLHVTLNALCAATTLVSLKLITALQGSAADFCD